MSEDDGDLPGLETIVLRSAGGKKRTKTGKKVKSFRYTLPTDHCKYCQIGDGTVIEETVISRNKILLTVLRR
jgi:hypothetical protein